MKTQSLLISYFPNANAPRPLERRWNGKTPAYFGRPLRWALEKDSEGILLRDLSAPRNRTYPVLEKKFGRASGAAISFEAGTREKFVIRALKTLEPAYASAGRPSSDSTVMQCYVCRGTRIVGEMTLPPLPHAFSDPMTGEQAFTLSHVPASGEIIESGEHQWRFVSVTLQALPAGALPPSEDAVRFRQSLRQAGAALLALLLVSAIWPKLSSPKPDELIPQQYAKLILKKPSAASSASPRGSSGPAPTRAKDTAVARAFRGKNFQRSLQNLLRGDLGKFAIAPSGKAAGALFASGKPGARTPGALRGIANAILGAENVAVASMGGATGYGTSGNSAVAGQGHSFIALDTKLASVDEGLTKEEVARVIHAHMNEIRYCYESAILRNSNLEGKLLLDFKIGAAGDVKKAEERESSFADRGVSGCVIRRLLAWRFPHPRGGVTVSISYPFLFKTLKR